MRKLSEKEKRIQEEANPKRLEDTEALFTIAMKKLSEKQKLIQEQAKLLKEKEKERKARILL